jgi:hydrogenase maturation protein HypF
MGHDGDIYKCLEDIGYLQRYGRSTLDMLLKIIDNRSLSPLTSGAGRLFDAVAALAGICHNSTYEGEAAVALESVLTDTDNYAETAPYGYRIHDGETSVIDFSEMIAQIAGEVKSQSDQGLISFRFHITMIKVIIDMVCRIREKTRMDRVALSGGCFQNAMLLKRTLGELSAHGFEVFTNENIPCNDACLSLGQAYLIRNANL